MANIAHCNTWIAVPQSALRRVSSVEKMREVMRSASSVVVVEKAAARARAVENHSSARVAVCSILTFLSTLVVCSKMVNFCWRLVKSTQRKSVMSPKMKKMSATTGMRYEIEFCKSMTSFSSASD